jgi:hypothetical protein
MLNCKKIKNHKQINFLHVKCNENYTTYKFQNFNNMFEKWKLQKNLGYKHKDHWMNII